ncbi:MAG TPA: DUF4124 domain-containing protein, partial [Gammaproteobacteria bacterium]|nr:DUF4124 domain-containing protein [Gammaproteobacteria bacterium]
MVRKIFARTVLPWALCLAFAGPVAAAMYKWTDADGNVHYSQTPPPSGQAEEMAPPPPSPLSPEEAEKRREQSRRSLLGEEEPEPEPAGDKTDQTGDNPARQKACEAARQNLQTLKTSRRIRD